MSAFSKQEKLASDLLQRKGIFIIHKVTRAGASFTIVKTALEKGLTVCVLTPTKNIIKKLQEELPSLLGYTPRMITVGPNCELCRKLDKKLGKKLAFQFKEDCSKCEFNGKPSECSYQNLHMNSFDLYCLTYDKLRALLQYRVKETTMIIDKLRGCDVLVLDEFATAALSQVQTIELFDKFKTAREQLRIIIKPLLPKNKNWANMLNTFLQYFENIKMSAIYENIVWNSVLLPEKAHSDYFVEGWLHITNVTKREIDTKDLQVAFLSMFAKKVIINVDGQNVSLTPWIDDVLAYLKSFIEIFGKDKAVFIVDSYLPSINFEAIFGDGTRDIFWGDPLDTNKMQLIVADTAHWGVRDFMKDWKLREKVKTILKMVLERFSPDKVLIVATNKHMAKEMHNWQLPSSVRITWYRSDLMRGIQAEDRKIMVCVGEPYLPKRAYTDSSKSFKMDDFVVEMEALISTEQKAVQIPFLLRWDNTRGEFVNAIGRVKDPLGRERSVIITLGMQGYEVKKLLKDNSPFPIPKPHITQTMFGGGMSDEGLIIAQLWFDGVEVEQPRHLAVLARIICHTKQKESVSASQIVIGQTELIKNIASKYQSVLEKYGVKVVLKQGGMSFAKA
jgi:hypothetical protein